MSLPLNAGRCTTRSGKLLDKSNKEQKEVFTTPKKDNDKLQRVRLQKSPAVMPHPLKNPTYVVCVKTP